MKKRLAPLFSLIILLTLLLSGCTNQVYDVNVMDDGRVDFGITLAIDVDIMNKLNEKNIDFGKIYKQNKDSVDDIDKVHSLFQETAWIYSNKGFLIEPIEDSVQVGFKAHKEYPSIEAFNDDLHLLYKSGLSQLKISVDHNKNFFGEKYIVDGTFNFMEDPEFKATEEEIEELKDMLDNPKISATLNLKTPGNLKEHNGEVQTGKVTFRGDYQKLEPTKVHLVSGFESDKAKVMMIGGIAIAGLAVAFLILRNFRKIKFILFRK